MRYPAIAISKHLPLFTHTTHTRQGPEKKMMSEGHDGLFALGTANLGLKE
jgi:hypothetical protein